MKFKQDHLDAKSRDFSSSAGGIDQPDCATMRPIPDMAARREKLSRSRLAWVAALVVFIAVSSVAGWKDEHPIEPALRIARDGLQHMRSNVRDYTATIAKRERASNGKLGDEQVMFCKIRSRKVDAEGEVLVPSQTKEELVEIKGRGLRRHAGTSLGRELDRNEPPPPSGRKL